jgi:hypothetical protein
MEAKYFCLSRKTILSCNRVFQSFLIHKAQSTPLWDPSGPLDETIERNTTRPLQQTTFSVPGLSICSLSPSLTEMAYLVSESFCEIFPSPRGGNKRTTEIFVAVEKTNYASRPGFQNFSFS